MGCYCNFSGDFCVGANPPPFFRNCCVRACQNSSYAELDAPKEKLDRAAKRRRYITKLLLNPPSKIYLFFSLVYPNCVFGNVRTCPFPFLINFHSIVLVSYGRCIKVTTQNSKVYHKGSKIVISWGAIAIFPGNSPSMPNPPSTIFLSKRLVADHRI